MNEMHKLSVYTTSAFLCIMKSVQLRGIDVIAFHPFIVPIILDPYH